jgi:hypothetical protein
MVDWIHPELGKFKLEILIDERIGSDGYRWRGHVLWLEGLS